MDTEHIIDLRHQEPFGGRHKVVGTAWSWGNPMRLCLILQRDGWSLGWRTHDAVGQIPDAWRDEDGGAIPERSTNEGDYKAFGDAGFDMRLPAFLDGIPVCGADTTDDPVQALGELSATDEHGRSDIRLERLDATSVRRALDALEWDGWTGTDERERGPIVDRVIATAKTRTRQVPDATIQAYLNTDYVIHVPQAVTLAIGEQSSELLRIYQRTGRPSMAFITAFNPEGAMKDEAVNTMADAHLRQDLEDYGSPSFAGIGVGRAGDWPGEPSYAVFGISMDHAVHLGRAHGQNAIVYADSSAVPKLLLLR